MATLEISASAVAWYGAIVATASVAVSAYNILRDRASLLITVTPNMRFINPDEPYESGTFMLVKVVNRGRRPITVTHVWFEGGRKAEKLLLADSVKHGVQELTEGKCVDYPCKQADIEVQSFKRVCVSDSTGRVHRRRIPGDVRRAIMQTHHEPKA